MMADYTLAPPSLYRFGICSRHHTIILGTPVDRDHLLKEEQDWEPLK